MRPKLAIVATHPIQYYAPWFAFLAKEASFDLRVFYLWDFGVTAKLDPGFKSRIQWDVPLLEGYEHEFVPNLSLRPGTSGFFGLWNPGLARRIRAYQPDAVLLTAYNFATTLYFLLRRAASDAPLIFRGDSHRLIRQSGSVAGVKRSLIAGIFRRFAAVLYVGAANREYFLLHQVADSRLFHSPHAVDNERFTGARRSAELAAGQWKASLGIPRNDRIVLFAGKFEEKKRPLDLLRAFVAADLAHVSLLFVGAGSQEAEMREVATGRGNIYFAPFQNQSRMPQVYSACDLFVLPSYGSAETWGLAVNEAMCMGRPVLASSHVGCAADLVIPGETGLIFPAGDVDALRKALCIAFEDPVRLKAWGERASERIKKFTYASASKGLYSAMESLGLAGTTSLQGP